jgi:hypothetical protein
MLKDSPKFKLIASIVGVKPRYNAIRAFAASNSGQSQQWQQQTAATIHHLQF